MTESVRGSRSVSSLFSIASIVKFFNAMLLFVFSYLVPKNDRLLVFGSHSGKLIGNPKYLLKYVSREFPDYTCVFCYKPAYASGFERTNVVGVDKNSFRAAWYVLRARYIFVSGGWSDVSKDHFIGRFRVINLWHGDPIKQVGFSVEGGAFSQPGLTSRILRSFFRYQYGKTHFFLTKGELFVPILSAGFATESVRVLGYPVNDLFFDGKFLDSVNQKFSEYADYDKVFLYAPTYREGGFDPFSKSSLLKLNAALKERNWLLIIKMHPFSNPLKMDCSHIVDVTREEYDFQELMSVSDVLISDYSGAISDFMVQQKPVILYLFDEQEYESVSRNLALDVKRLLPGPVAQNTTELIRVISSIDSFVADPSYKKKYEKINNKMNKYLDGNSSKRICEALEIK